MKDKTKKLLKKGLRLAGAIGLTTLTLGGSFLLGFEAGKATYDKKEEPTVSAAKAKSALQPKRAITHSVSGNPTTNHPTWANTNALYFNPNITNAYEKGAIMLDGEDIIVWTDNDYRNLGLYDVVTLVWGYDDIVTVQGYNRDTEDYEAYEVPWTDAVRKTIHIENKNLAWSTISLHDSEATPSFDGLLTTCLKDIRTTEYFAPSSSSDWLSLFTANPLGACMIEYNQHWESYPRGQYAIEMNGQVYWGAQIFPDFRDVQANTSIQIDKYGTPARVATSDEYEYLAGINFYVNDYESALQMVKNNWSVNGIQIENGLMTNYWAYTAGGPTTEEGSLKIYNWGTMTEKATTYPNGSAGYASYFEYTRAIGGQTIQPFEPIIVGGQDNANVTNVFALIGSAFAGLAPILAIQILPSLTIGTLMLVPFIVTMVIVIIKMLRK